MSILVRHMSGVRSCFLVDVIFFIGIVGFLGGSFLGDLDFSYFFV